MNLLNVREVSRRLNLSEPYVRALAKDGRLPCIRLAKKAIRFSEDEIERFLQERGMTKYDAI